MCLSKKIILDNLRFPFDAKDSQGKMMCEDHAYCKSAGEKGYRIWIDNTIECLHFRGEVILGHKAPKGYKLTTEVPRLDFRRID